MPDPVTPAVAPAWPIPESIASIPDSALQQRATEAWRAASQLRSVKDQWTRWFLELQSTGDADPGLAMRMAESVAVCVRALSDLHVDMPTFRQAAPAELLARFPRPPWPRTNPPWQEDQEYRQQMRELFQRLEWHSLSGELLSFLQTLQVAPSTAFLAFPQAPSDDRELPALLTSLSAAVTDIRQLMEPPPLKSQALEILPGGIRYGKVTVDLRGKPLACIRELLDAHHHRLDWRALRSRVWGEDAYTEKATIKNAIADARDALRKLARLANISIDEHFDPLPCADHGKDTAWKLEFPG